jgi:hypothetical protein
MKMVVRPGCTGKPYQQVDKASGVYATCLGDIVVRRYTFTPPFMLKLLRKQ